MDSRYNHSKYEKKIYSLWEKSGAFTPKIDRQKKPFTIIMPPPNANENLHIGHARFVAIEDILTRYHRMLGESTLWLPGADHAGIETQFVFEKKLKEKGKSRSDFPRATLYKMIWDYSLEKKKVMESQLRALGASCDWSRNLFTLDPKIIKIVYKTFKKLYDDGLIYRGERIVNYCPLCGTSFSQLEVNYTEREDWLYYLDYKTITIATTRPETIFADVAVAVNPHDSKNSKLTGKTAIIPLLERVIPIISDYLVDPDFGTGALKITPGHDSLDFEIGEKHNLPIISVVDNDGKMVNTPPKYIGLSVLKAREEVLRDLGEKGLIKKRQKLSHTVGVCYKHKKPIEPLVSKQWFIKIKPLAKLAKSALKNHQVKIVVKKYEKISLHWLNNLKDWNISRQIVWGIRIPAFRCDKCLKWTITEGSVPKTCIECGHNKLIQDADTFDTWFSSGQWPFATLMSSSKSEIRNQKSKTSINVQPADDFKYFYPTSVMETAYDILAFWVLRMIMLGIYITGKAPFKDVVLHGLVRDKEGKKISKSKGNVIDPIEMTEKYGADALRMGIVWGTLIENDIALSEDNVRGQRNFSNKLWNIARLIKMQLEENNIKSYDDLPSFSKRLKGLTNQDKLVVSEFENLVKSVTKDLEKYRLSSATENLYKFTWRNFADNYLESTKKRLRNRDRNALIVSRFILINTLKLLHPFMPFVTEAIWQELKDLRKYPNELLISSSWPKN